MAIQFVFGRAGSGKTQYCLASIRKRLHESQRGPALVLLVPEQATYQAERELATTPGLGGYCRASVTSFRRLAFEVMTVVGGGALPPLDDAGKQMVLRSILRRRAPELRLFGKSAHQRGFVERLAKTLSELRFYGQWADALRRELIRLEERNEGQSLLAAKLHDLALIIDEYDRFFAERYIDPDCYLDVLARQLPNAERFRNARVWIDGFASFTAQEERVVEGLMRLATETHIALCIDPKEVGVSPAGQEQAARQPPHESFSMFSLLSDTYWRLRALAQANNLLVRPPILLPAEGQPTRFTRAPALAHLEKHAFDFTADKQAGVSCNGAIRVSGAPDQRAEVINAACEILRLCREEEKDFRFRDIAVIVRDLAPYRSLVETIFSDFEIPHFIDARRDAAHHPLAELLRSVLAVVTRNWRSEDVIRFAKTDLVPLERGAIDRLENYVLAHGIEGEVWHAPEPWRYRLRLAFGEDDEQEVEPVELGAINATRDALVAPLRDFCAKLANGAPKTVRLICTALHDLLIQLRVPERLEEWAAESERVGRLGEADEHRQVWKEIMGLFDQAVIALDRRLETPGGKEEGQESVNPEEITLEEFRDILESGLAGIRLRLIPPALDQVLVGAIERSRHPAIKAVFVLGLNERTFPQPIPQDVIFNDRERDRLARDQMRLGPASEKRLLHERFLAYIAFTRPSERLYVSYARADSAGKVLHPSPFVDELTRCFGGGAAPGDWSHSNEYAAHWRTVVSSMCAALRWESARAGGTLASHSPEAQREHYAGLYNRMREDARFAGKLSCRLGGLAYENKAALAPDTARRLYGDSTHSSVSRLECFGACCFKHFVRYGLRLQERLRFTIGDFDLGLLYHAVLRDVFLRLKGAGRAVDWSRVDPERADALVKESIDALGKQLRNEVLLSSGKNRFLLDTAREALAGFVQVLIAASTRDGFEQVDAELAFQTGGKLPALVIAAEGTTLSLRGQIDRVDRCRDGRNIIRIIDYKSRPRRFARDLVVHGLALQLPAYLLAIDRAVRQRDPGRRPVLAGGLYMPILKGLTSVRPSEAARESDRDDEMLKPWKAYGLFAAEWAVLFDHVVCEETGRSPTVNLHIRKDGTPGATCDAVSAELLEGVLAWCERKMIEYVDRIHKGDASICPYELGSQTACRLCSFGTVCRFDAKQHPYRTLPKRVSLEQIRNA